jgi:hypothetical protein
LSGEDTIQEEISFEEFIDDDYSSSTSQDDEL